MGALTVHSPLVSLSRIWSVYLSLGVLPFWHLSNNLQLIIIIDPEVCFNDMYVGNTTVHYYGRFVCPDGDDDDYAYCCGDIGEQYCCKFFDTR